MCGEDGGDREAGYCQEGDEGDGVNGLEGYGWWQQQGEEGGKQASHEGESTA